MKKIAIVMTYFERQLQLNRTLLSMHGKDFEVIIVDDCSPTDIVLPPSLPYPVKIIKITDKKWINGVPAYNIGIQKALDHGAEIIIIQNAECFHYGDVIGKAGTIQEGQYISFGCFSINKESILYGHNISSIIRSNNFGAGYDGQNAWYNHPIHRPVGYHFCAAITAENMIKLNGFDEGFADGWGYEDNDLLTRIKNMGLKIEITETPFVVHQWHYNNMGVPENKEELVNRNRVLLTKLLKENNYRAKHIYTDDFAD